MGADDALSLAGALSATAAAIVNLIAYRMCRGRGFVSPTVPVLRFAAGLAATYSIGLWLAVAQVWTRSEYFRWFGYLGPVVWLTVWTLPAAGLIQLVRKLGPPVPARTPPTP